MELIKILFFVLGSFFGIKNSSVLSEKTTVTINPLEKTIIILHEDLVAPIQSDTDSLKVRTELINILDPKHKWSEEFKDYSKKEKHFYISEDESALNSKISLTYTKATDLKAFGIDLNKDGKYSMMNFPKSHIKSKDGILGERYWNFEANTPFTFTTEPLIDIPEEFKIYKKRLLPIWKTIVH